MSHELSLSIVGAGGDGAVAAGDILASACARDGLHVIKTEAYGPQIRGGESSCTVRISAAPIHAQADALDAMVVLSWADFARFRDELTLAPDAIVFHDEKDAPPETMSAFRLVAMPFAAQKSSKNVFALGLLAATFGFPADKIRDAVRKRFAKKTEAVIEANVKAFDAGIELGLAGTKRLSYVACEPKVLMAGNDASAKGAVEAGCRFFAGYPITPSSEVLHYLAEKLPPLGGTCLQTEDELAAIGAVVGASFAGAKAMTATSGPGLSLMSEMLGLSAMAEVPAVIVNVQRGGPSTGIPTKSEQSDLWHALYGGHGDTPRVVLACTDVEDSFHTTVDGFNIAEEFQIPVIVMSEQSIAQSRQTVDGTLTHKALDRRLPNDEELVEYRRYRVTNDGVSPMSIPGIKGGEYQTNGLEHDERGRPSSISSLHETMNAKRWRKLDAIAAKYSDLFIRFGPENPDLGILCWGASTGVVREAVDRLTAQGIRVAAFSPRLVMPLPKEAIQQFIDAANELLVIELSHAAQFHKYLRAELELPRAKTHVHARSGGRNLTVTEVMDQVRRVLAPAAEEVLV